jgi:phosphoribosylformylglycinamidine synthase
MSDTNRAVSMDLKMAGDLIYIVGGTQNELGGSEYFRSLGFIGNTVPKVNPHQSRKLMERLSLATKAGLVRACHDLSEGGIGIAIAEMAFAGGLGATVSLKDVPLGDHIERDDLILFSESNSRFLVEVAPDDREQFERILGKTSFANIGQVTSSGILEILSIKGRKIASISIVELKEAWQKPLRW